MSSSKIEHERSRLRADYEQVTASALKHFYCPILLEDTNAELCMGHVVNKSIANSVRRQVLQVKDVDGFYGSLVEGAFSTLIKAKNQPSWNALFDKSLARHIQPTIHIDGQHVEHYPVADLDSAKHPVVTFVGAPDRFVDIALKTSDKVSLESCNAQILVNCNYLAEATAALIKAAHLSMFAMCGYHYVFTAAGYHVARILQQFYCENRNRTRAEQTEAARIYFRAHSGMIAPLEKYDTNVLCGTVEDHRILVCIGSSGKPFAFAVLVRADDTMHMVFLPSGNAHNADTFADFVTNEKSIFHIKIAEYRPTEDGKDFAWYSDASPPIRMELAPRYRN